MALLTIMVCVIIIATHSSRTTSRAKKRVEYGARLAELKRQARVREEADRLSREAGLR